MAQTQQTDIVIIGGGIIGCTTAYYLSRHPLYNSETTKIIVLEASAYGVAQGASGKAGGLVAKWAYPAELVDISFPEHVRLAKEHDGVDRWGFRFVECGTWEGVGEDLKRDPGSGVGKGGKQKSLEKTLGVGWNAHAGGINNRHPEGLNWIKEELTTSYAPMDPTTGLEGTAQVHPYLFTTSMMELAAEKGVKLWRGSATRIGIESGRVTGVRYTDPTDGQENFIPATHVILAAGAWSPLLLSSLPVSATRAHSVTFRPKAGVDIAPYVLFTDIKLPRGLHASPEVYARPNNEVYACGPGDDSKLPGNVDEVEVDQTACESIREQVVSISPELREGTVEKRQACFLPIVSHRGAGGPIVGEAKTVAAGLYVTTGHTCWGICNAPGTAKVMAELVLNGKASPRKLKRLDPSHFL
ncbi:FAD dependent oxidoreductase [Pisolithus marmoratus]|nr:FAD dependent oxidoreductase [Pisolithus marmoratus]